MCPRSLTEALSQGSSALTWLVQLPVKVGWLVAHSMVQAPRAGNLLLCLVRASSSFVPNMRLHPSHQPPYGPCSPWTGGGWQLVKSSFCPP